MKIKSFIRKVIVIGAIAVLPAVVWAQGPGGPGPDPDPGDAVPFDGGLSLLIAAGVGIGAKKAYDRKKKLERENQINKD